MPDEWYKPAELLNNMTDIAVDKFTVLSNNNRGIF